MYSQLKIVLIFFLFFFLCDPLSSGAKMVSINREGVNIRSGPSTRSQVKWKVDKGFPLKVIGRKGKWYKVRDFENDEGWVYAPLTIRKAHLVVKKPVINIRRGPGPNYRIITQAKHGVVFQTLTEVKGWVKVRHESGVTGWVARRLLWGW
ncbi:MAG: SH3 domain-containing protein [Desulfocapsaceae bacterium]|nr:SH3 domain-containing protein [Desulfocapsaceae bacterium]